MNDRSRKEKYNQARDQMQNLHFFPTPSLSHHQNQDQPIFYVLRILSLTKYQEADAWLLFPHFHLCIISLQLKEASSCNYIRLNLVQPQ